MLKIMIVKKRPKLYFLWELNLLTVAWISLIIKTELITELDPYLMFTSYLVKLNQI